MAPFVHAKVEIAETAATIGADGRFVEAAVDAIKAARKSVERMVRKDRFFMTTMEPYDCDVDEPLIVRMCEASRALRVGPMATVAGAIAQTAMEAMIAEGCTHGWVDNGGDVALVLEEPVTMEIFCEPGAQTASAFELEPTASAMGVCASSGTLGHSLSLGSSDVAVAIADDAIIADAMATALGNSATDVESLDRCFDSVRGVRGFRGGLVVMGGRVAAHGNVPKLVEVEHNPDRMTIHTKMSSQSFTGLSAGCRGVNS